MKPHTHTFHVSLITGVNLRFGSPLRILFIFLPFTDNLSQTKLRSLAGLSLATGSQCEKEYVKLERRSKESYVIGIEVLKEPQLS